MSKKVILKVNTNEHDMLSCIRELKKFADRSEFEIRVEEIEGVHYFTVLHEEMQLEKLSWKDKLKGVFVANNNANNISKEYEYSNNTSKNISSWKDSIKYDVKNRNMPPRNYNDYSSNINYKNTTRYGYYDSERY